MPGARLEWRWRPWLPPPPPCWYGRFLIMCSGRRRREPASAPARTGAPASARSRSRRAAAGAALPAPGVNGCAAPERVNEARRRGKRRRRRRRRRCGDWDAPWSRAARSLWAVLEALPLPRPPPPLPLPTWFQSCAQAGPAGGREGGRTGGARGLYLTKTTTSTKLPDGKERRAASHQGSPFKLQICWSSLYNSLLHGHYREVHHVSAYWSKMKEFLLRPQK
ncbi:PREDICTED: uncharacterized protein LOC101403414 isoform X2 [Ceratotherium simum simum]|uniref:Uncharacterized protein LOC101403414 isoform X2 n=1 Tax=Ceratotherium simum simum TaxID=73337 RepID=A0ABM1CXE2_CERSS|nr:PREDICTED: uncharacterized protein LOC101403414 isoform X2 [Ceratotherium simum simum]